MEKTPLREEEIKELEDEIDLAVDRLFVEKRKGLNEPLLQEPPGLKPTLEQSFEPALEPSFEPTLESSLEGSEKPGKDFDFEESFTLPPSPPSPPPSYLKSIDQLEAQLLALEWEISDEKLQKTQEAVHSLNQLLKQRNDVGSVLGFMDDILNQMTADAEKIRPPMIKFLLDGKETIKLLLRKETEGEIPIYKQLALEGMEGRFAGLQERKEVPSQTTPLPVEKESPDHPSLEWEKVEEMLGQWKVFYGRAEETLHQIDQRFSQFERIRTEPPAISVRAEETLHQIDQRLSQLERIRTEPPAVSVREGRTLTDITIFKAYGKCYGIESQKIFKLFKVPPSFQEKYGHQSKVRLRDFDVSLIDLQRIFPEETSNPEGAAKLLMIHGEGEYKGLIVEEVLKRLRVSLEERREDGKPVLGTLHWTYESHPVEVPILDPNRI